MINWYGVVLMTKTWLDKLCEPLENPKYPQIKGALVKKIGEKIIGKCAEGEIACQNNIKYERYQLELPTEAFIKLGVPHDLLTDLPCYNSFYNNFRFADFESTSLSSIIISLNDTAELSYDELAEFLRTTFEDAV